MFITTAYTLGVAHPPGYPLTNMMGHMAGTLPIGNFAFRCNLLSSFFAALAVYFFYRSLLLLIKDKTISSIFAVLFGLSGNLWTQAVIFEVYAAYYAIFFGLLWISLSGRLNDFRWLLFSAFIFGIGVTQHLSLSVTIFTFILLWVGSRSKWSYKVDTKKIIVILLSGIMSWGVYVYILARSASHDEKILFSWGRVNDFSSLLSFITGYILKDYEYNAAPLSSRLDIFTSYLTQAIPLWILPILIFLFLKGVIALYKEEKITLASLLLSQILLTIFSMIQFAAIDILLVIPWAITLMFTAYGITHLTPTIRLAIIRSAFPALLIFLIDQFSRYDYHNDYGSYDYLIDLYDTQPEDGEIRLTQGIQSNYIVLFGQKIIKKNSKAENKYEYSPYLLPELNLAKPYGILNTNNLALSKSDQIEVWNHIRSFPLQEESKNRRPASLTRYMFKSMVEARILLQRGYALIYFDNIDEAKIVFRNAIDLSFETASQDIPGLLKSGKRDSAKILIQELLEKKPEPWLIKLSGVIQ
jgi:hypothetical protein